MFRVFEILRNTFNNNNELSLSGQNQSVNISINGSTLMLKSDNYSVKKIRTYLINEYMKNNVQSVRQFSFRKCLEMKMVKKWMLMETRWTMMWTVYLIIIFYFFLKYLNWISTDKSSKTYQFNQLFWFKQIQLNHQNYQVTINSKCFKLT